MSARRSARSTVLRAFALPVAIGLSLLLAGGPAAASPLATTKMTFKLDTHQIAPGTDVTGSLTMFTHAKNRWEPFVDAPFTIRVGGVDVGTGTTDANGRAAISFTPTGTGDHVIRVVFLGDATHRKAQRAQGFTVETSTTSTGGTIAV